jgi:hypothetical protein
MLHQSSLFLASLAAFGAISAPLALAAPLNPPSYTAGDIFMGFRATGGQGATDVYVVNIGQAAYYRDATTTVTPSLGNINADLAILYGSGWQTRTDILWGVAGTPSNSAGSPINGDTTPTLYASKLLTTVGSPGAGWSIPGASTRNTIATNIATFYSGFVTYEQSVNSANAVIQGDSDVFSWRQFMSAGGNVSYTSGNKDFGGFADIESQPAQKLSLFRMVSASAGSYEGYFAISAAGVLTFTPPASGTSYSAWATLNAGGQAANLDFNKDGVANGVEWFTGSSKNPPIISGTVTWPRATGNVAATSVKVQTSNDLILWTNAVIGLQSGSGSISYTLPTGQPKFFVRLNVTP